MSNTSRRADQLTDAEIDRRFDDAEARLDAQWRAEAKDRGKHFRGLRAAAPEQPSPAPSPDVVQIECILPTPKRTPEHIRLFITTEVDCFLAAASCVNDFPPVDGQPAWMRNAFASWFQCRFSEVDDAQYVRRAAEALYDCRYDKRPHRWSSKQTWRSPRVLKKCVMAEANRFERQKDWRASNPCLAAHYADAFRALAALIYTLPRGQGPSSDPNRMFIEAVIELSGAAGDEILTRGHKAGSAGGARPSPGRARLINSIRRRKDALERLGITEASIKDALHRMDRRRER